MNKIDNIDEILDLLGFEPTGHFDNNFYVIDLKDSNEYAKAYTKLDKNAVNTEYPTIELNSTKSTNKIRNYFEYSYDGIDYNIFLTADFKNGLYSIKLGEK